MAILEQLRNAIRDSGQSYDEIAKSTGVGKSAISHFVNDVHELGVNKAEALAKHFGLSIKPDKKKPKK